jgi:hypothetical protein
MKYLDLESTRILKVDEIYPYSLQCDACQQIFIREPVAISISHRVPSTIKNRNRCNQNFFFLAELEPKCEMYSDLDPNPI